MNRLNIFLLCLLMGWCVVLPTVQAQDKLYIYHTNDTHSTIDPVEPAYPDTALAGKAGAVRRATLLHRLRKEHGADRVLLFDSGDFSQGSPYYALFKGEVEIDLMNAMGYDACTLGNHEFDFGLDNLARLVRRAHFPVVCANYHFEDTPLDGLIKPYVILHRGGLKIGVFGLSPRPQGLIFSEYYRGVRYEDPVVAANRVAALLKRKKHCDLVICLSHLGWKGAESDETLIASTRHIDLVLGGHSHSYFEHPLTYPNLDGLPVPVQQMGKYGRFLGWIEVDYSRESSHSE